MVDPTRRQIAMMADEVGAQRCPAPVPPAGEEVAELVAWLRETGDLIQPSHLAEHQKYKRAAELLYGYGCGYGGGYGTPSPNRGRRP